MRARYPLSCSRFRQIETIEPAGTILDAVEMDDAGLSGLIDASRDAGVDLIEIVVTSDPLIRPSALSHCQASTTGSSS